MTDEAKRKIAEMQRQQIPESYARPFHVMDRWQMIHKQGYLAKVGEAHLKHCEKNPISPAATQDITAAPTVYCGFNVQMQNGDMAYMDGLMTAPTCDEPVIVETPE